MIVEGLNHCLNVSLTDGEALSSSSKANKIALRIAEASGLSMLVFEIKEF